MVIQLLLGMAILALVAATYAVLSWKAAVRFGVRILLITWPAASLLLLAYYLTRPIHPGFFSTSSYAIFALAVFLAFGLSTRSVWRRLMGAPSSKLLSVTAVARATGAFFVGFVLGLLPLLVFDILAFTRRA